METSVVTNDNMGVLGAKLTSRHAQSGSVVCTWWHGGKNALIAWKKNWRKIFGCACAEHSSNNTISFPEPMCLLVTKTRELSSSETTETQGRLVGARGNKSGKVCLSSFLCPIYFLSPQLTASGSPRMESSGLQHGVQSQCGCLPPRHPVRSGKV